MMAVTKPQYLIMKGVEKTRETAEKSFHQVWQCIYFSFPRQNPRIVLFFLYCTK